MPQLADERGRLLPSTAPLAKYYASHRVQRTSSTPANVNRAAKRHTLPQGFGAFMKDCPPPSPAIRDRQAADVSQEEKIELTTAALGAQELATAAASTPSRAAKAAMVSPSKASELSYHDDDEIMAQMDFGQAEEAINAEPLELNEEEMWEKMVALRNTRDVVPKGVTEWFARRLWEQVSPADCSPEDLVARNRVLGSDDATPQGRGLIGSVGPTSKTPSTSRRRLFGDHEPTLGQRVLGVLNKVTSDESKYREVKNELMRLPLPEASDDEMKAVVNVFFDKAVREQRFSSLYAHLVCEICRIPPGQTQTGDVKRSLAYRFRVALVNQCQAEFEKPFALTAKDKVDEDGNALPAEEVERRYLAMKKRVTGNVKFVGEMYKGLIISSAIIRLIIVQLLTGSKNELMLLGEPRPVDDHIPEDYEFEMLLTLLRTTGQYLMISKHASILNDALPRVFYWAENHRTKRIQYLMQDCRDLANRNFRPKPAELAAMTPEERSRQRNFEETLRQKGYQTSDAPKPSSSNSDRTPARGTGGGRDLASPPPFGSAVQPPGGAEHLTPTPSRLPPQPTSSPSTDSSYPTGQQHATPELIAPLMTKLADTANFEAAATHIFSNFAHPMAALETWLRRSMKVMKAERERRQLGPLFCAAVNLRLADRVELEGMCLSLLNEHLETGAWEELPIWKFWAQAVAGDAESMVLDQGYHLHAFVWLLQNDSTETAVALLQAVLTVNNAMDPWPSPSTRNGFKHFRFLAALVAINFEGGQHKEPELEYKLLNTKKLRKLDVSIEAFCLLHEQRFEDMFQLVQSHPRLGDPCFPAKIMSAVLCAGVANDISVMDDASPSLAAAVDGVLRAERECVIIGEMASSLRDHFGDHVLQSFATNVITRLKKAHIVSTESVDIVKGFWSTSEDPTAYLGPTRHQAAALS